MSNVKVIRLPPRNVKQALEELCKAHGDELKDFFFIGMSKDSDPILYASFDDIEKFASCRLIMDVFINDSVETIRHS